MNRFTQRASRGVRGGAGPAALLLAFLPSSLASAQALRGADTVYSYEPNLSRMPAGPFDDPAAALGLPSWGHSPTTPDNSSIVSVGDGGRITLAFNSPVADQPAWSANPYGYDLLVFSNAFNAGASSRFIEPGFVEVARKNLSDAPDTWYLILPRDFTSGSPVNRDPVDVPSSATGFSTLVLDGMADVTPANGDPAARFVLDDPATRAVEGWGGAGVDLARAVIESSPGIPLMDGGGNYQFVNLPSVDFIRITDLRPNDQQIFASTWNSSEVDAVLRVPLIKTWSSSAGGSWNDGTKWDHGTSPNASDQVAIFGAAVSGNIAVSLDQPVTLGALKFSNASASYTLTGSSLLALGAAGGPAQVLVTSGQHQINAPVQLGNDLDVYIAADSSLTVGSLSNPSGHALGKTGAGTLSLAGPQSHGSGASLAVHQGSVQLTGAADQLLVLSALTIDRDLDTQQYLGELDLKNNNLAIRAPSGSGQNVWLNTIQPAVLAGFNNGAFASQGITSSTAAGAGTTVLAAVINDDGSGNPLFANGSDIGAGSGQTEFASLGALTTDDILIKYTYFGDLDLSGQIDGLDQALIDIFFGTIGGGWLLGDIDYNGQTDGLDQALLDIFFGNGTGGAFGDPLDAAPANTPIPEPTTLIFLAAAVPLLLCRSRRPLHTPPHPSFEP